MMPAVPMRAKRPNRGEWYCTCGMATVANSPSRTPTICRMRRASLSSAMARGLVKISVALSMASTRRP
jgi:hypothetical protein